MTFGEIAFLAMVVGALTLFAGVLAWAQWMEGRDRNGQKRAAQNVAGPQHTAQLAHRAF